MRKAVRGFYRVADVLAWGGYVAVVAIIVIVFIDVFGRYFFNKPLMGAYELVLLAMMPLGGLAIMYTAAKRGHVAIDLVVCRFPRTIRTVMRSAASLLGFGIWAAMAYQAYLGALDLLKSTETSSTLLIRPGPFLLILAIATLMCSLAFFIQAFHHESDEGPEAKCGEAADEL